MAWFISADTSSKECLDRIKSWLSDCQENHPSCRAGWLEKATPLPKRVIDVGGSTLSTKDIVRIEESQGGDGPYIALSHCWGKVQLLTTTKETLRSRMAGISWSDLPPTFQEAITMTRHFGVRYLWIDSLCILQNDPQDWEEQSAEMGRIYGNAIITISATASSDSTQGLFRCAAPEYTAVKVVHGHEYQDIYARKRLQHDNYYPGPLNTNDFFLPLQTRAWVLQEHYLSPRVLQFSSDEVVWECNNGLHCECSEGHRPTAQLPPKSSWYGFLKSVDDPDAFDLRSRREAWSRLVSSYTTRKLTFPHDKLPAFSGLARVMQPYFGGRYLAGLWESDLVYGLGWYILNEILPSKPSGYRAPSWAWAAIDGKVQQQPFRESLIQVIEVVYELTSSDPFSTVRGASIRARGKIIKATLRYDVRE